MDNDENEEGRSWQREVRPVPDPTILTTQALLREVASLEKRLETKFDSYDKAISLLQSNADRSPTVAVVHALVLHLQELTEQKFVGIATQFAERDARTEQTSRDNKVAIDAALQAQKEAVAKSEVGVTKQIDNLTVNISTLAKAIEDKINQSAELSRARDAATNSKIDELTNRVTLIDGRSTGIANGWGYLVGGLGLLATIVMMGIGLASLYLRAQP